MIDRCSIFKFLYEIIDNAVDSLLQGYIFCKILCWGGGNGCWGKKIKTEGVEKKLKRREKGKRKKRLKNASVNM